MTDLSRLIEDLCTGLDGSKTSEFSVLPKTLSGDQKLYQIDNVETSWSFQPFRSETEGSAKTDEPGSSNAVAPPSEIAHTSYRVETSERPERPETEAKTLAGSTSPFFPVEKIEPERPETEGQARKRPFLDLNLANPQRSNWWTGDLMAEVDRAAPPPGDPLPISPSDVRAGVARELRVLAEDGREGPAALRDAVEITRAKIRNSEALAERQANGAACHVCDEALDDILPVIAVLSGKPGAHLFLHAACHAAYRARRTVLVDRIMASAGYGETLTNGEAA